MRREKWWGELSNFLLVVVVVVVVVGVWGGRVEEKRKYNEEDI